MDSSTPESKKEAKKNNINGSLIRCCFALAYSLFTVFSVSYLVAIFAFFLDSFTISPPISVPSQCKIVSSRVDLRSSKICELRLLNYKAKHVFYPSEKKKFRCHYDYCWASVFKVEYREHFSDQMLLGLAEAPNEALPSDCRPSFAAAWSTKHMLKVNETYDCWYTSGRSKVEIVQDSYFGCQGKDPSAYEMMRRYSILSTRMLLFWLSGQLKVKHIGWEMIGSAIGGFFTALVTTILFTLCRRLFIRFRRVVAENVSTLTQQIFFTRIFFLVAYFSIIGWVAIQYAKRLGLTKIIVEY